jgi:hypothetical protein
MISAQVAATLLLFSKKRQGTTLQAAEKRQ